MLGLITVLGDKGNMQDRLTLPIDQKLWNQYDAYQKMILENIGSDRKKGLCLPY